MVIIFVFDPLAVLLLIASQYTFEQRRKQKRELYGEEPEDEDKNAKIESLEETLDNVLDDIPNKVNQFETYLNDIDVVYEEVVAEAPINLDLDIDGDGIISDDEKAADLDGDGKISEEELRNQYENGGWKQPYKDKQYYHHPWFNWKNKERWINDR